MYEEFYGFRENPFRLTPDPDYLFLSPNHQEALGHLLFGISEGSGVVIITGEIGTGKTTLLRTLIRNLDSQTIVAYVFNPALSALELLQTINTDLGLPASSTSKKELIDELNRFLLDQQAEGRRVAVIIDEAQNLEPAVLEQLRLLSNLETERAKLLQIILVGQPELREMLAQPGLAQLDQRVTLRWHLGPLNARETAAYVRHRLRVAADGRELVTFTSAALRKVYSFSRGVPRLINILCHRVLLIGYTREERRIGLAIVRQATREVHSHEREGYALLSWRTVAMNGALVGVGLLLVWTFIGPASVRSWLSGAQGIDIPVEQEIEFGPQTELPLPLSAQTDLVQPVGSSIPPVPHEQTAASVAPAAQKSVAADTILNALQQTDLVDSAVRATGGLLEAWEVKALQPSEWQNGSLDLSNIARTRGLEYLPLTGTLNQLAILNLPVILEVLVPPHQDVRFVLLLGISEDRGRVLIDRERDIPLRILTNNWFGKSHLFWKDFDDVGGLLSVGSVGRSVERLHDLLLEAQTGSEDALVSEIQGRVGQRTYNRQTQEAVARFQKAKRLTPDGVVGPFTLIMLYNSLPRYASPHLQMLDTSATAEGAVNREQTEERITRARPPLTQEGA